MIFDSVGLGYSAANDGEIRVHYPRKDKETGEVFPGEGGILSFRVPEHYWTDPPNEATRERVAIWRQLLEAK